MSELVVTIDMDGPGVYAGLHGFEPPAVDATTLYEAPLERFVELCQSLGGHGTVFVVARDVNARVAARLRGLEIFGDEVACHSLSHDHRLSTRDAGSIRAELEECKRVLAEATGRAPVGFRAPGYQRSATLTQALNEAGFAYDSSLLASPLYEATKRAVLGVYERLGKPSSSQPAAWDEIRTAPRVQREGALVQLPIALSRALRVPLTGGVLALAPALAMKPLVRWVVPADVVVVNFHALDFASRRELGWPRELTRRIAELHIPLFVRMARYRAALAALARGRDVVPAREAARRAS